MRRTVTQILLAVAAAALIAGCSAGPYARRAAVAGPGNQGAAWEVVFPPSRAVVEAGPEEGRRDHALAHAPESALPPDAWPEPYRPGLERARRLFLTNDPDEVFYLRQQPPYDWRRHRHWSWW